MKKIYSNDGNRTITMIYVRIEFSREIAYWDSACYHENPKFMEWWDAKFWPYCNRRFETPLWHTAYCNQHSAELAEEGKLESNVIRYLHCLGNANILIAPQMSAFLFHDPSVFPTTHEIGLAELAQICHACAKYCGGTVKITYSSSQHRFEWNDANPKEIELGTGHSDLYKTKEPKRSKKVREVNHTWEKNPKTTEQ